MTDTFSTLSVDLHRNHYSGETITPILKTKPTVTQLNAHSPSWTPSIYPIPIQDVDLECNENSKKDEELDQESEDTSEIGFPMDLTAIADSPNNLEFYTHDAESQKPELEHAKIISTQNTPLTKEVGGEMDFNFFADEEPTQEFNFFAEAETETVNRPVETETAEPKTESNDTQATPTLNPPIIPYGGKFGTVYLCTDGGSRMSDSLAATGWVLYNSKWNLIHAKGMVLNSGTNNDAELLAALDGLEYVISVKKNTRVIHLTDSKLVEGGITGESKLNSHRHQTIRRKIMSLQGKNGNFIMSYQLPRESNSGADRMCNLSMDALESTYQFHVEPKDIEEDRMKTRSYVEMNLVSNFMHYGEAAMLTHNRKLSLVMSELLFKHANHDGACSVPGGFLHVKEVNGEKRETGFETDTKMIEMDGIERVIPIEAISKIKMECHRHGIKWHDSAFAKSEYIGSTPDKDIALLSALCRAIGNDVSTIIKWYRNQNENDNRPNKHLRPDLYESTLQIIPV